MTILLNFFCYLAGLLVLFVFAAFDLGALHWISKLTRLPFKVGLVIFSLAGIFCLFAGRVYQAKLMGFAGVLLIAPLGAMVFLMWTWLLWTMVSSVTKRIIAIKR